MKKALVIIIIFIVFCGLTLTLLDVFGILSITGVVRESIETHPRIEPYLHTAEDRREFEEKITVLQGQLERVKGEKEEVERINRSLEDLVERYQERIDELEASLEESREEIEDRKERIRQIASIYSQMKPDQAATVLAELADDLVIELVLRWEDRFAARVLAEMDSERSARLTRILSE